MKKLLILLTFQALLLAENNIELENEKIEKENETSNYVVSGQVGLFYTQGYGNYLGDTENIGERKIDFSNIFASVGFEGIEFDALRFGLNALGSIKLSGGKSISGLDVYKDAISSNGILYQAFAGYTSDYFDISLGREVLDLEWVNDFVQGGRFSVKLPNANTNINGFYFDRQAVADPNEIVTFEDNKVGPTFILGISNNSLEFLALDAYFMSFDLFNGIGFGGALLFGSDDFISSNTIIKYTYLDSKKQDFNNTNFLQIEENLNFNLESNQFSIALGIIKMFNSKNLDILEISILGDQNPLEQGDFAYAKNALTAYLGGTYSYRDVVEISLIYGNTSGIKAWDSASNLDSNIKSMHELNLGINTFWNGLEIGVIYSKILSNELEINNKKLNKDYIETMIAYSF